MQASQYITGTLETLDSVVLVLNLQIVWNWVWTYNFAQVTIVSKRAAKRKWLLMIGRSNGSLKSWHGLTIKHPKKMTDIDLLTITIGPGGAILDSFTSSNFSSSWVWGIINTLYWIWQTQEFWILQSGRGLNGSVHGNVLGPYMQAAFPCMHMCACVCAHLNNGWLLKMAGFSLFFRQLEMMTIPGCPC